MLTITAFLGTTSPFRLRRLGALTPNPDRPRYSALNGLQRKPIAPKEDPTDSASNTRWESSVHFRRRGRLNMTHNLDRLQKTGAWSAGVLDNGFRSTAAARRFAGDPAAACGNGGGAGESARRHGDDPRGRTQCSTAGISASGIRRTPRDDRGSWCDASNRPDPWRATSRESATTTTMWCVGPAGPSRTSTAPSATRRV